MQPLTDFRPAPAVKLTAITDNSKSPTGSGNPLRACGPDQNWQNLKQPTWYASDL